MKASAKDLDLGKSSKLAPAIPVVIRGGDVFQKSSTSFWKFQVIVLSTNSVQGQTSQSQQMADD